MNYTTVTLETKVVSPGIVRVVGSRIAGLKEGMWIDYNSDGTIGQCYTYVHDSLIGEELSFNEAGKIFTKRHLDGEKLEGEWIVFYDFAKNKIAERGVYKHGRKSGVWDYYNEEGKLDKKIEYRGDSSFILIDNKSDIQMPSSIDKDVDSNNRAEVGSGRE